MTNRIGYVGPQVNIPKDSVGGAGDIASKNRLPAFNIWHFARRKKLMKNTSSFRRGGRYEEYSTHIYLPLARTADP